MLLHHEITDAILGDFYVVHAELGSGFLELVYRNALALALADRGLHVEREVGFEVVFRGRGVGRYRADLVVESKVIVEVKAARAIDSAHCAQLRNYLRASGLEVGLLNFGASAHFTRLIATPRIVRTR